MYKHILLPTDGSDTAQKGVEHGLALATTLGARVTIVTASEPFPYTSRAAAAGWFPGDGEMATYAKAQKDHAEGVLKTAKEAADKAGATAETLHVVDTHPAIAIMDAAKDGGCDLIVMSSHGRRGIGRLLLGSQTSEVLSSSPVPVLVVR